MITQATPRAIAEAARLLRSGGLVAFPTETVYGLGADATDDRAVARIFSAKQRPDFNPLIVHAPDLAAVEDMVEMTPLARRLAARFWPGPLTLVLTRREGCAVSRLVSAGLDTLAVRIPDHPVGQALLQATGRPIAAPSANRSSEVSPTLAAHVQASLGAAVDMILDGGPCRVGLESSVVMACGETPVLLRPGGVTLEDLEQAVGKVVVSGEATGAPASPGQLLQHYAPSRPVRLNAVEPRPGEALLGFGRVEECALNLSPTSDVEEAAANLFAMLRGLDRPEFAAIAVSPIPERGLGQAINDRLRRAAATHKTQ